MGSNGPTEMSYSIAPTLKTPSAVLWFVARTGLNLSDVFGLLSVFTFVTVQNMNLVK